MRKKLLNVAAALLLAVLVTPLAACAGNTAQTEADQTPLETEQGMEEIHLKDPVPTCGLEASGQWYAWQGVVGGDLSITDGATNEKMEFEETTSVFRLFDIQEYDIEHGDHEWPTKLHVTLADGTEGDITNPDVINDLWDRIVWMRISPDLAMEDPGTFVNNVFVFSWDDGRRQTFTFTGQYALTVDGTLFPLLEGINSAGEIFNGPVVSPIKNSKYPEVVFDTARMVIEDGLGKRTVFFIKYGSTTMDYSEDTFTWNANNDGWGSETYLVKRVKGTDSAPSGIRIEGENSNNPWSCIIEGATRLYVIEMVRDDGDNYIYPKITYQPEDSEEPAVCTIKLVDDEFVVDYL